MKKYLLVATAFFTINSYAEEGYVGHFRGNQNLEIRGCGDSRSINRSIDHWEITITKDAENSFVGQLDRRYGLITYKATIDEDGKVKGKMSGMDTSARRWTGFFTATIDGDELKINVSGILTPGACRFQGKIDATRQQKTE